MKFHLDVITGASVVRAIGTVSNVHAIYRELDVFPLSRCHNPVTILQAVVRRTYLSLERLTCGRN